MRPALALLGLLLLAGVGALGWRLLTEQEPPVATPVPAVEPEAPEPAPPVATVPEPATEPEAPAEPDPTPPAPTPPAPEPPPAMRLRGRLLAGALADGAPATPAAGLELEAHGRSLEPDLLAVARSDPEGRFELELAPGLERVWLRVAGDERFRELRRVVLLPAPGELALARAPRGRPEGRVTGPDGRPLAGVELRFEDRPEPALSGPEGRFDLPEGHPPPALIGARLAGHVPLRRRPPRREPDGGWEPLELVLAPTGALQVRVEDPSGVPLPGIRVAARRAARDPAPWDDRVGERVSAPTDAEGRAGLADLPAGEPLLLELREETARHEALGNRGGELALAGEPGEPVTVPADGTLELRAELPPRLELTGRVLAAAGGPAAGASVRLWDPRGELARETTADADGRFAFAPRLEPGAGPLCLAARRARADGGLDLAWKVVEPDAAADGRLERELRLTAASTLRASLSTGLEETGSFTIRALPAGSGALGELSPWSASANGEELEARPTRYGEFQLGPLPAGAHDLFAYRDGGAPGQPTHRFHEVRTGTSTNLLILPTELPVRLLLHPLGGSAEVRAVEVVLARWYPRDAGARVPADAIALTRVGGWRGERWRGLAGVERAELEGGTLVARSVRLDRATAELPPTPEGWYWFGVRPVGAGWALVSGGPHYLTAGMHELGYALVPTGALEVELEREGDELLAVMLVDDLGETISLPSAGGRVRRTRELRVRDRALLRGVPAGEHTLRVGTERELLLGRARHEQPVSVEAGATARVTVTLP